jgi:SAM-dependent methyltransferase
MEHGKISYAPTLDAMRSENDLRELLVPGVMVDRGLERRIERLSERFRTYARRYPYGLWAQGLSESLEMRNMTEVYLPMEEIVRAFDRLFSLSLRFAPFRPSSILHASSGWLDFLQRIQPNVKRPDPGKLLKGLAADEGERRRFIFANFMPPRYGGGFGRYSGQTRFLAEWLEENRKRLAGSVRCLDTACGSGEGTYDLARLLLAKGFSPGSIYIAGSSMEPLELFAAAHASFPHDPIREIKYRQSIGRLRDSGVFERMSFSLEMLGSGSVHGGEKFDIILCNGFLGGPFMHDKEGIEETLAELAGRLAPGGALLATNRFHGGWGHLVSEETMQRMLVRCGLGLLPVADGVGGVRT